MVWAKVAVGLHPRWTYLLAHHTECPVDPCERYSRVLLLSALRVQNLQVHWGQPHRQSNPLVTGNQIEHGRRQEVGMAIQKHMVCGFQVGWSGEDCGQRRISRLLQVAGEGRGGGLEGLYCLCRQVCRVDAELDQ